MEIRDPGEKILQEPFPKHRFREVLQLGTVSPRGLSALNFLFQDRYALSI